MRFFHVLESFQEDGWRYTLQEMIHLKKREIILMQMDLAELKSQRRNTQQQEIELIAIDKDNFKDLKLDYRLRNRYLKALTNLKNGYYGYVLKKGNKVLGDVWCAFYQGENLPMHPDIDSLEFTVEENDVYGYDMYIAPAERGNSSLASLLLGGALQDLKEKGYNRLLCYVYADKIPAIWIHRMLGFKEIQRGESRRFLFLKSLKNTSNRKVLKDSMLKINTLGR